MTMEKAALLCMCVVLAGGAIGGEPAAAGFAKKPTAAKEGAGCRIEFAVDRETDVAVFVENSAGKIVRHLVAGVLGKNPPPPLKPGLAQSLVWDGKADYGKPADGGPYKVRVALGLGARYDRVLRGGPGMGNIQGVAAGPDGTVFVLSAWGRNLPNGSGSIMLAFNRDGTYQRTIMPFPSNLSKERLAGVAAIELDGRPAPRVRSVDDNRDFYGGFIPFRKGGMAVSKDGQILFPVKGGTLASVDREGGIAPGGFRGAALPATLQGRERSRARIMVAASGDGKYAYVSGLGKPTVYRVKLPERTGAEPFFGEGAPAGDKQLAGNPGGLAIDGKGNLLVADPAGKRVVVVSEADGKFVGSFAADRPDCLGVDPDTGAVFVSRPAGRGVEVVKYSGWKDAAVVARTMLEKGGGNPEFAGVMALDASSRPPVVWVGLESGALLRTEDLGAKFSDAKDANPRQGGYFEDLTVDHVRNEVYCAAWSRYSEAEDKWQGLSSLGGPKGWIQQVVPGMDGYLYVTGYPAWMARFDCDGKAAPWPDIGKSTIPAVTDMYGPGGSGRMLGVHPDGRVFNFENPRGKEKQCDDRIIRQYRDGKPVAWGPVWHLGETGVGPRFDQEGNIYVAENILPKDFDPPPEMKLSAHLYGSIVKFSPKGGVFGYPGATMPADGSKPEIDPALPELDGLASRGRGGSARVPVKVTGALWMAPGVSRVDRCRCPCESIHFDVDLFGRVFYPDLGRFRVGVLDTAGNEITHFGGYGNADSRGPESPVVDPKTKLVRPRLPTDPKDMKSPFAEPEIAFSWLLGVGVTDRYAYMGDTLNGRLLRAKLVYTVEETCSIGP
ncbi:MAG: hypothetical protein L6Q38_00400 [Nitrospira sp.]|nr:hypothetical protein [Nitrospira sp.]